MLSRTTLPRAPRSGGLRLGGLLLAAAAWSGCAALPMMIQDDEDLDYRAAASADRERRPPPDAAAPVPTIGGGRAGSGGLRATAPAAASDKPAGRPARTFSAFPVGPDGQRLSPESLDPEEDDETMAEEAIPDLIGRRYETSAPGIPENAIRPPDRSREEIARVIAVLRRPGASDQPELIRILRHPADEYAPYAAVALARALGQAAIPELRRAAAGDRADVRAAAQAGLAGLEPPPDDLADLLYEGLADPDRRVRENTANLVGEIRLADPVLIDTLRRLVRSDDATPQEWRAGVWALARLGDDLGLFLLLQAADDPRDPRDNDDQQKYWALNALGDVANPIALPLLYRRLFSGDNMLETLAFQAMEQFPTAAHIAYLDTLPPDEALDRANRRALNRFAAGLGPPPPTFIDQLLNGTERERQLLLRGLADHGELELIPATLAALWAFEESREVFGPRSPAAQQTRQALAEAATRLELPPHPGELAAAAAWRRWWFRLHRVTEALPERARLRFPDGREAEIRPGGVLPGGGEVIIDPGTGRTRVLVRIDAETVTLRWVGE